MTTNIITPSGAGHRCVFPSAKNQRAVSCQSLLELDACRFLEFCPDVLSYEEQVEVEIQVNGKPRTVRPDFHCKTYEQSLVVVEVKPSAKLEKPQIKERLARVREHLAQLDIPYRVLTEVDLQRQPLQKNLVRLMGFRSFRPIPVPEFVRRQLPSSGEPLSEVVERLQDYQLAMRLLANQHLHTDLGTPITMNSIVSTNSEEFANELVRL